MAIVAGFEVHRAQITFDALDTETGGGHARSDRLHGGGHRPLGGKPSTRSATSSTPLKCAGVTGLASEDLEDSRFAFTDEACRASSRHLAARGAEAVMGEFPGLLALSMKVNAVVAGA